MNTKSITKWIPRFLFAIGTLAFAFSFYAYTSNKLVTKYDVLEKIKNDYDQVNLNKKSASGFNPSEYNDSAQNMADKLNYENNQVFITGFITSGIFLIVGYIVLLSQRKQQQQIYVETKHHNYDIDN